MAMEVTNVIEGSPAYCAGIKVGDILLVAKANKMNVKLDNWPAWQFIAYSPGAKDITFYIKLGTNLRVRSVISPTPYIGVTVRPTVVNDKALYAEIERKHTLKNCAFKVKRPKITVKEKVALTPSIKYSAELQEAEEEIKLAQALLSDMKGVEAKAIASGVRGKLFNHLTNGIKEKEDAMASTFKPCHLIRWGRVIGAVAALTAIGAGACAILL